MMASPTRPPPEAHRKSPIDDVIAQREDGTDITVFDRIVGAIRTGAFFEHAVASAGVPKQTVYGWLRMAGQLRIQHAGDFTEAHLSPHQARCVAFSDALDHAAAAWAIDSNTTLERVGRGGLPQEVETLEYDAKGELTKRTVRKTVTLPEAKVIENRLKARFPHLYAERIEVSGPGGGPIELSQEEHASALLVLAQRFVEEGPKRKRKLPERASVEGVRELEDAE